MQTAPERMTSYLAACAPLRFRLSLPALSRFIRTSTVFFRASRDGAPKFGVVRVWERLVWCVLLVVHLPAVWECWAAAGTVGAGIVGGVERGAAGGGPPLTSVLALHASVLLFAAKSFGSQRLQWRGDGAWLVLVLLGIALLHLPAFAPVLGPAVATPTVSLVAAAALLAACREVQVLLGDWLVALADGLTHELRARGVRGAVVAAVMPRARIAGGDSQPRSPPC